MCVCLPDLYDLKASVKRKAAMEGKNVATFVLYALYNFLPLAEMQQTCVLKCK